MNQLRCLAAILLFSACTVESAEFRPVLAGDPAPAFSAQSLSGDTVSLTSFRGSPVLLNIWATWCAPCRDEMPELQALHERYHESGLIVVGVSVDAPGSEDPIRRFMAEYGLSFMVLFDPADDVSRKFRTTGVPETFLIDAEGKIAHRWIGRFEPLSSDALTRIEAVLPAVARPGDAGPQ